MLIRHANIISTTQVTFPSNRDVLGYVTASAAAQEVAPPLQPRTPPFTARAPGAGAAAREDLARRGRGCLRTRGAGRGRTERSRAEPTPAARPAGRRHCGAGGLHRSGRARRRTGGGALRPGPAVTHHVDFRDHVDAGDLYPHAHIHGRTCGESGRRR